DNEMIKCDADGLGTSTIEDCGNNVCAYWLEQCLPALPGDNACMPDGRLVRVEGNGDLTLLEQCAGPGACDPERGCLIGACRVGSTTCDGADVLDCTDGSDTSPSGDECSSAARCSPGIGCNQPIAVAAGDSHTCAIFGGEDAADGDPGFLMCWGANESGQLGNGSSVLGDSMEPRYVVRDDDAGLPPVAMPNATSVCAGRDFTCATVVTPDGPRVACWGSNAKGQLGIDSEEITPVNHAGQLVATADGPIAADSIACGSDFACALGPDGSTWCWGANDYGQIGNGAAGDPVLLATLIADQAFLSIGAGAHHACGVKDGGAVFCWGQGMGGQLGSGDTEDADAPAEVDGVTALVGLPPTLGRDFSIIASSETNPFAFGTNGYGQLATGDTADSSSAVAAGELNSDEIDNLFAGASSAHACARIASTLVCWGANVFGQLGDDSTDSATSPVEVFDGATNPTKVRPGAHSVAVGGKHTCAINVSGDLLCWGANHRSQLGTDQATPVTKPTLSL
ncbi:MAG TPA: hypothetical protein VM686_06940, partial [Polyangiaceae bacterium]|nr:hypothetical protein [Polyangiaceae bacterium]